MQRTTASTSWLAWRSISAASHKAKAFRIPGLFRRSARPVCFDLSPPSLSVHLRWLTIIFWVTIAMPTAFYCLVPQIVHTLPAANILISVPISLLPKISPPKSCLYGEKGEFYYPQVVVRQIF